MLVKEFQDHENDTRPPRYLYKYQSFKDGYSLYNLGRHQFFFSKPINLNDPFDFNTNFILNEVTDQELRIAFDHVRKGISDNLGNNFNAAKFDKTYLSNGKPNKRFIIFLSGGGNEGIQKFIRANKGIGVTCFSEKNDSILMWSHYSDGHHGFCLEFDTHFAPFYYDIRIFDIILIQVVYSKSYPSLSLKEINESNGLVHPIKPLARNKWKDWSYEKEWRLISWRGSMEFPYDPSSLTSIYLGMTISSDDEKKLFEEIAKLPARKNGLQRNIYKMQQSKTHFKVIPVKI
jgi:hypothetical protein